MKKRFQDQVVVVTGSSAGIGNATALAFAREGATLALISRNEERLQQLKKQIEAMGSHALVLPLDVSDEKAVEEAAEKTEQELGPIDIWVNNAMVSVFSPVIEMQPDEYRRVTEVTYLGTVFGTLTALKRMLPRNKGKIILVGSALAYRGIPLQSSYCAAKHAIQGFQDSLLSELIHYKSRVKVTMVQLSAHNTPQFDWVRSRLPHRAEPVPPIYQPEVAARAILHAALHYKREWIVGYPAFKAIWGNKFFPNVADRYLARTGFKSQQTEAIKHNRPDNLYQTVAGNYGAHGRFDKQAKSRSFFWLLTINSRAIWLVLLLIIVAVVTWLIAG